ncbi:hypothetical protein ACVWXO_000925 [Bradyrhizobium sp. LM2.7]
MHDKIRPEYLERKPILVCGSRQPVRSCTITRAAPCSMRCTVA